MVMNLTKETLREHIREYHRTLPASVKTLKQMQQWHARQHHQYTVTSHYHEGSNTGPGDRPVGWYTGEGVVDKRCTCGPNRVWHDKSLVPCYDPDDDGSADA